jgi:hypothetical protein
MAYAFSLMFSCVCEPTGLSRTAAALKTHGDGAAEPECKIIYAGFVGAMETSDHKSSGVVQIRDTLRGPSYGDVCANSFIPYKPSLGLDWILGHFPSHEGAFKSEELRNGPKIILYGHSTGGWAMLSVARELQRREIPVELTVQADSVGITDLTIPSNVKEGAIFHANDVLMFMTTKRLKVQDARKTTIVANVLVKGANHLSVTRDPRIRELVMKTVEQLRLTGKSEESGMVEK